MKAVQRKCKTIDWFYDPPTGQDCKSNEAMRYSEKNDKTKLKLEHGKTDDTVSAMQNEIKAESQTALIGTS